MEPIIEVKNLTKVFSQPDRPDVYAVNDVSFSVMPGEILGIVGESGSGKSTIAKLLTRLIDATSGTIIVDGQDITSLKGRKLMNVYGKIQMVFQTPTGSFDPRKTLGDGICESMRNKGMSKAASLAKAEDLLERCGLPREFVKRYPHEVSGGQCQRAAFARALANDPEILILDEATSALDVTVQKQVLELLTEIQSQTGITCLFICHNLALVQQLCDHVVVMYDGKLVESGTPDEVIFNPQDDYTKKLIEAVF